MAALAVLVGGGGATALMHEHAQGMAALMGGETIKKGGPKPTFQRSDGSPKSAKEK